MTNINAIDTANRKPERMVVLGICLTAIVALLYCLWALDRGFEITDEAYYLLLSMNTSAQTLYISAQHWIMSWLWHATGSLIMFRAAGLLILTAAAWLLAHGVLTTADRLRLTASPYARPVVISSSIVAALLYAYTINLSPSYNLLASAGAYAAAGFVLLATHCRSQLPKMLGYTLAGSAIAIETLCKASAGVSTALIMLFWLCSFERSHGQRIAGMVSMAAGAAVLGWLALITNTTFDAASQAFTQGMELFRIVQSEAIHTRLIRYVTQFGQHLLTTGLYYAAPLLLIAAYAKTGRRVLFYLSIASLALTLLLTRQWLGGWNSDLSLTPPYAIVAILIMALTLTAGRWIANLHTAALLLGLLALPYSVAMGTGNTLFTQVVVSMAPWGALIGILAVAPGRNTKSPPLAALVITLCLLSTVVIQLVTSGLRPYQISTPLFAQDQRFETGSVGAVKVDTGTHRFLSDLKAAGERCGITAGTAFLGLYNIPGVAVALNVEPLMSPWLNNVEQARFVLNRVDPKALENVVIGVNTGAAGHIPSLPEQLKGFPGGYRECGTATYPFGPQQIQIWRR